MINNSVNVKTMLFCFHI